MEALILIPIAIVVLFLWMLFRVVALGGEVGTLNGHLARLDTELYALKRKLTEEEAARSERKAPLEAKVPAKDAADRVQTPPALASPHRTFAEVTAPQADVTKAKAPTPESTAVPPALGGGSPGVLPPAVPAVPLLRPHAEPVLAATQAKAEVQPVVPFNWEQFMGAKLFAWVGGLALFLSVAFFVKYSFEKNLIPAEVRVAMGFLTGLGLLVGGTVLKRKAYEVTAQTLCATGVVILYAVTFACCSHYHFIQESVAFGLMVLVTATAFLLAVRMKAVVVAVLGLVGGFLTPPLLSTGVDNPLGLFGYVALLDAGLVAVALRRRWHYLIAMGALGTVVMQLGWAHEFFAVHKVFTAMAVFLGFNLLFLAAFVVGERSKQTNWWLSGSAMALPFVTMGFVFSLLGYREIGARPGVLFTFLLGADLCLLGLVLLRHALHQAHLVAGMVVFLALTAWTTGHLTAELLNWALGGYFLFAVLHSVFPVVLQRVRPGVAKVWWGHLFPPLGLLLVLVPLFRDVEVSWAIWPCILLIDLVAIGLAVLTASVLSIITVLVLTVVATAVWLLKIPAELTGLPPFLTVVGGFAVFFFLVGLFAGEKILARLEAASAGESNPDLDAPESLRTGGSPLEVKAQIPALAAVLPFLLLIMASVRLPMINPTPVYAMGFFLVILLLGVVRLTGVGLLVPVGLGCVLALQHSWYFGHFTPDHGLAPLVWSLLFTALFTVFPFLFKRAMARQMLPWATSALAGPLHFYLVHHIVKAAYPNHFMGLLPLAFAGPMLLGLVFVVRRFLADEGPRSALLAWFGGSALFFITLIFPVQFDKQWITIGWGLEGVALLWLFHRVPHPGLRGTGSALLVAAFVRLALNPTVLHYHTRAPGEGAILNWFLYAYGIVAICLMMGARLLAPPRNLVFGRSAPPVFYTLGTVLMFLLLNIEIADYFSTGPVLTFDFSGDFARDMTYSIAWALFSLAMLTVGVAKRLRPVRYASLALLGVTALKLFLHDLARLEALYRVGALLGVAIISIVASVLYQRFFAKAAAVPTPQ